MKRLVAAAFVPNPEVVPYIGTWIETIGICYVGGLDAVVPYIGTWIETLSETRKIEDEIVVPYIGTWIETLRIGRQR